MLRLFITLAARFPLNSLSLSTQPITFLFRHGPGRSYDRSYNRYNQVFAQYCEKNEAESFLSVYHTWSLSNLIHRWGAMKFIDINKCMVRLLEGKKSILPCKATEKLYKNLAKDSIALGHHDHLHRKCDRLKARYMSHPHSISSRNFLPRSVYIAFEWISDLFEIP